ncbi:MAG TPA: response regulator transcription factor [Alphaproteobacteria bacterium]|nr:response regulator transcription factor [Alphaproteobacteria bacterium]
MNVLAPANPAQSSRTAKVVLVEDKAGVRESWTKLINSLAGFSCVASCSSGEDALRLIPALAPDIVLMDIFLPRMSGIECTGRLKLLLPKTQIIILTGVEDDELVFMALEAGADGYLLKRTRPDDLRAAMVNVMGGGAPMTSEIARLVVESFRKSTSTAKPVVRLSAREEEVLILLSKGYSNKEIASQLSIGVETISSHLKHIYKKLHVRSRAEAVAHYMTGKA